MKKILKKETGITLIALVITIVVLIILAGVAITLTLGDNGIFKKATNAKESYQIAEAKEYVELKIANLQADMQGKATLQDVIDYLSDDEEVTYFVSLDKVATIEGTESIGEANEIYVVYNKFQFKIKKDLKVEYISKVNIETVKNNVSLDFSIGTEGFISTNGEITTETNGLTYKTFPTTSKDGTWYYLESEKEISNTLDSKFEISSQIYFDNPTTYDMGGVLIELIENDVTKATIGINDAWERSNMITLYATVDGNNIYANNISTTNADGKYSIIGDGSKVYFYNGETLLGSIDYTEKISYDKIKITYQKYRDNNHGVPKVYVRDLYIGEPKTK